MSGKEDPGIEKELERLFELGLPDVKGAKWVKVESHDHQPVIPGTLASNSNDAFSGNGWLLSERKGRVNPYLRTDCTDEALDRTISRLSGSTFKIEGDAAKLTIKWDKDDGYPNSVLFYSNDQPFRESHGEWKLDICPEGDAEGMADLFKPGSWGCAFRDGMNLLNAAIEDIESGKLQTWQQVAEELEKKGEVLARKWAEDHQDPAPQPAKRRTQP